MSVKAISWVWDHSRAEGLDRFVLVAIADCANDQGQQAYPSTASLATKTGLSVRSIQRSVAALVALGELTCEQNAGRRGTNLYGLPMRPPSQSHPRQPDTPVTQSRTPVRLTGTPVTQSPNPRQPDTRTVRDPSETRQEPSPSCPVSSRADVEAVCVAMADAVEANGSKRPTITQRWRTEARLLLDKDGRSEAQVLAAIAWCQADDFWKAVVLSLPKLREKYDQMRLAAQRQGNEPTRRKGASAIAREVAERTRANLHAVGEQ